MKIGNRHSNSDLYFENKYKRLLKSKSSQIGTTITWMVGLVIIVFIMALFSIGVIGLSKIKDAREIDVKKASENALINSQQLDYILNKVSNRQADVFSKKTNREKIYEWAKGGTEKVRLKGELIEEIDKILVGLNQGGKSCYFFHVALDDTDLSKFHLESSVEEKSVEIESGEVRLSRAYPKSLRAYIFSESHLIKINFYFGEC